MPAGSSFSTVCDPAVTWVSAAPMSMPFWKKNLDDAVAAQRLRLDMLDCVDQRGELALLVVDDPVGHVPRQKPGVQAMSKKSGSRNPAKHSRFHDFNINCCDLHRHRSALDCFCRVLVGVSAADPQLLQPVEPRGIARWGASVQRIYLADNLRRR
jgi:hypothetical protein